jgi:hypothetical protein
MILQGPDLSWRMTGSGASGKGDAGLMGAACPADSLEVASDIAKSRISGN